MRKLRYFFEYGSYPVWTYNEDGMLVDNDLPDELRGCRELDDMLMKCAERYDALFINNSAQFHYRGFQTAEEEQEFDAAALTALEMLKKCAGNKYEIVNDYLPNRQ